MDVCVGPFYTYGSHDVRHVDFRGLMGCQRTPWVLGRHRVFLSWKQLSFMVEQKIE